MMDEAINHSRSNEGIILFRIAPQSRKARLVMIAMDHIHTVGDTLKEEFRPLLVYGETA